VDRSTVDRQGLPAADEHRPIEAVDIRQLPELTSAEAEDIVDAEIVETRREELR
jgi:hypothetical protein